MLTKRFLFSESIGFLLRRLVVQYIDSVEDAAVFSCVKSDKGIPVVSPPGVPLISYDPCISCVPNQKHGMVDIIVVVCKAFEGSRGIKIPVIVSPHVDSNRSILQKSFERINII